MHACRSTLEDPTVDGAGPASDRYALGIIAFELLAGAQPFSASSAPQMMEQHFRAEVPALATRGGVGLPGGLDRVLRKALAKDPADRYGSARAFVAALREAAGTAAMRARGIALPTDGGPRGKRLWVPAVAGLVVLGVGVAIVVTTGRERRDIDARPREQGAPAVPAGTVKVFVTSTPSGAEVRTTDGMSATTPADLYARTGQALELTVRKAGYRTAKQRLDIGASAAAVTVKLDSIDGFTGVWALPTGELRAFERRDDHVDAFKLSAVTGPRTFFTQYAFELADDGVRFGGEDLIADPQAPNEPTCNVRMRVDYIYDPTADTLEQRREHVDLAYRNGTCVERSRRVVPLALVRVDRGDAESHELAMPVGTPADMVETQKAPRKTVQKKPAQKSPPPASKQKNTAPYTSKASKNAVDAQILPDANAPAPQVAEPPPQQQQATPVKK